MSEYPNVIGLGGKLMAGKDLCADYLVDKYGYVKLGMSDVLAEAVYTLNPIIWPTGRMSGIIDPIRYQDGVDLHGYTEAKKNPEVRRLLQVFGTEIGRKMFGEDFWVAQAEARVHAQLDLGNRVVLTGVRYENELQMIQFMGKAWWIDRPGFGDTGSHASENSVDPGRFDRTIINSGSIEKLQNLVSYVMES